MDRIVLNVNGAVVYDSAPAPAAPATPNPFVAWKAEGFDLVQIQVWKLKRPMTEDDWTQAIAAGYTRDTPGSGGGGTVVDTSAPTLDFSVVRGVPIKLTGPKTIIGCPDQVIVRVFPVSGDPTTQVNYNVTINGAAYPVTGIAVFDTSQRGIAVGGPEVSVSVDSPGVEFLIQSA